jgi:Fe-S-cluster formation regulator IscX/YfhJ
MSLSPAILANDPDIEAERQLLEAAVAEAEADPRYVTHEDMRAWLLRLAQGDFDAHLPELRAP